LQNKILTKNFSKKFKIEDIVPAGKLKENEYEKNNNFFASLKSLKKGVGSGV
jgi:hypothetical protein